MIKRGRAAIISNISNINGDGMRLRLVARTGNKHSRSFTITETAHTMAFSLVTVPASTFSFKNLLRHYAKKGAYTIHGK